MRLLPRVVFYVHFLLSYFFGLRQVLRRTGHTRLGPVRIKPYVTSVEVFVQNNTHKTGQVRKPIPFFKCILQFIKFDRALPIVFSPWAAEGIFND